MGSYTPRKVKRREHKKRAFIDFGTKNHEIQETPRDLKFDEKGKLVR